PRCLRCRLCSVHVGWYDVGSGRSFEFESGGVIVKPARRWGSCWCIHVEREGGALLTTGQPRARVCTLKRTRGERRERLEIWWMVPCMKHSEDGRTALSWVGFGRGMVWSV
ncbi:unnamed protein product, partial [Hapterophycus canaliculatus]